MHLHLDPAAILAPQELETERLHLKPLTEVFKAYALKGLSDNAMRAATKQALLDTPARQNQWWENAQKEHLAGRLVRWCAFAKEDGRYLALLTIKEIDYQNYRGEVGYSLLRAEWGKGFGTEAVSRIVDYAFEVIGLHSLCAMILPDNIPSQRLIKRLGFEQEACFRELHLYENCFYDVLQFSRINPRH